MNELTIESLNTIVPDIDFSFILTPGWKGSLKDLLKVTTLANSVKAEIAFGTLPDRLNRIFAIWCAEEALKQINFTSTQIDSLIEKAKSFANGDNLAIEIEVYWGHLRQSLSIDSQAVLSTLSAAFNTKEKPSTIAAQASDSLWKSYRDSNQMNGSMSHQIQKIKSLIEEQPHNQQSIDHQCQAVNVGFTSRTLACRICGKSMTD